MSRGLPLFDQHPYSYADAQQMGMFRGYCVHVVDGDTYDILIDKGFYDYSVIAVRLYGIDTAEIFSGPPEERTRGQEAKAFVTGILLNQPVLIRTFKDTKTFDRYVAIVETSQGSVAELLQAAGFNEA